MLVGWCELRLVRLESFCVGRSAWYIFYVVSGKYLNIVLVDVLALIRL
jgi:hypothetical protein